MRQEKRPPAAKAGNGKGYRITAFVLDPNKLQIKNEQLRIIRGNIIWTTGFSGNFSYIKLPVLDSDGNPKHRDDISDIEGLYFIGLPWMRHRKSTILFGIKEDAGFICDKAYSYSQKNKMEQTN